MIRVRAAQLGEAMALPAGCLIYVDGDVIVGELSSPVLGTEVEIMVDRSDIVRHIIESGGDRVAAAMAITELHLSSRGK